MHNEGRGGEERLRSNGTEQMVDLRLKNCISSAISLTSEAMRIIVYSDYELRNFMMIPTRVEFQFSSMEL